MATAKLKIGKLVFNSANQNLILFLDELQKQAEDAFRIATHDIIEQFIHAEVPSHLKKSINQTHLVNGTYEQNVRRLEKESELNGSKSPDELQKNTVSKHAFNSNTTDPN